MDLGWYRDLNEWFPDRDQSYVPIWGAHWSDYSGCAWVVILDRDGQLYELDYCYSPESKDNQARWDPWPITYERAMEVLKEWEEFLD